MPDSRKTYRDLKVLHQRQVKCESHYEFAVLCLNNNVIPSSLRIRTQPQVPQSKYKQELLEQWNEALMGTSRMLLKILNKYHHKVVSLLIKEEVALDVRLRKRQDYEEEIKKIEKFTRQTTEEYRNKRTKNIRLLLGNDKITKKTRKGRRKKKHHTKERKEQSIWNHNTVLNISSVPLSSDERNLLLRGLSFCPRLSEISNLKLTISNWRKTFVSFSDEGGENDEFFMMREEKTIMI